MPVYGKDKVYWLSPVGGFDDFGDPIKGEIIDGATTNGQWAIMTPKSWLLHGAYPTLGVGRGQRYVEQPDGAWLKVEG